MSHKTLHFCLTVLFAHALFVIGCSAQTEEQALQSLRQMTAGGKLPSEAVVSQIESRFANKRTGALARLLHAHIKFENKDYAGAAALLESDVFGKRTRIEDHAMMLRGRSLQALGRHADAMTAFERLINEHPGSIRVREAKLAWVNSAISGGQNVNTSAYLGDLVRANDPEALLAAGKYFESKGSELEAVGHYRRLYFYAPGTDAAKEAEAKLISLSQPLTPQNADEQLARADALFNAKKWDLAHSAYLSLSAQFPTAITPQTRVRRIIVTSNLRKMADAQSAFDSLPVSASREREEGYYHLALGYARAKMWPQARQTVEQMRGQFPGSSWTPRTMAEVGFAAREAKWRGDDTYYLNGVVSGYPNAVEAAQAQFEMAWAQHENRNFAVSSQMLIEHLARYTDKDTTNRGKAGYWAARDSQRAGKMAEACSLYEAVGYRYGANWYGYIALDRLSAMKAAGQCGGPAPKDPTIGRAIANLKKVTVAAETAKEQELDRAEKSDELSTVGLFDWAFEELNEAKKTAGNSPKINLALARHYRLKGDQVNALLSLGKSYPDYAQMFPEEMGRDEWDIFYPLTHWADIKKWAGIRGLDPYQVAGIIRQETIFDVDAKSHANAYGLMQLLLPTAKSVARKYGTTVPTSPSELYNPSLNIELGTAYMKDQFEKFGRFEFVGIAYNAGPGRVPQWRASLPIEMDEFVEAIPFKETRGYVQGITRNSAQYRRLYDANGNFKPNVGTRPLRGEIDAKPRDQAIADNPDLVVDDAAASE